MWYPIIIIIIAIGDEFIKNYIEKKEFSKDEYILHDTIILTKYHNKGAMLNFLENQKKILCYLSGTVLGITLIAFAMILPYKKNKLLKTALSLILGGAFSNFYDRIKRGYVVDYFSFKWLKNIIFNISDICIFLGTLITTIVIVIFPDKKRYE